MKVRGEVKNKTKIVVNVRKHAIHPCTYTGETCTENCLGMNVREEMKDKTGKP